MRILILAPQPFFQDRGTPIAVDHLLRSLSFLDHDVQALVMEEGADRLYPGVQITRAPLPPGIRNIRPGFSIKKMIADIPFYTKAKELVRSWRPDVIHAVEESAFMANRIRKQTGIPYLYDMDSSLAQQMADANVLFRLFSPVLKSMERRLISRSLDTVPVCEALAVLARAGGARSIHLLPDISLLRDNGIQPIEVDTPPPPSKTPSFMYVGNLEAYQGVPLLLEATARCMKQKQTIQVHIIGGRPEHIKARKRDCARLGIAGVVHFWGPRPLGMMGPLFQYADVLVSPRIQGQNTPMKLYSYLDSGKPVLATRLETHTQVVDDDCAMLAGPTPNAFAQAMITLCKDPALRARLAARARTLIETHHTHEAYLERVRRLYSDVALKLNLPASP